MRFRRLVIVCVVLPALMPAWDGGLSTVMRPQGHCLRRCVASVPLKLVARVQNEAQVAGPVGADQRAAVQDARDLLQALRNLYAIHRGLDRRKRAQHAIRFQARFIGCVALGVEGFGLRHAAGHPQQDDGVGGGLKLWRLPKKLARRSARQRG